LAILNGSALVPLPFEASASQTLRAVAVKVTGDPVRPDAVAVRVFGPAVAPRVHVGEVAMPSAPVVTVAGEPRVPPPVATANVTETPATGALPAPVTRTAGDVATDPAIGAL
jgi:hypothetical protein